MPLNWQFDEATEPKVDTAVKPKVEAAVKPKVGVIAAFEVNNAVEHEADTQM